METKFNFKSSVCTSREQSERLLALGLKKETADMYWLDHALTEDYEDWRATPIYNDWEEWQRYGIPAWSLGRLIEMALRFVLICGISFNFDEDAYEKVIGIIEYQIKAGYFNKEYLV